MQKLYRSEYPGEFVITNTVFRNGRKEQEREWVDNPIQNTSSSLRACCVTTHSTLISPTLKQIQNHRGGVLGRDKMQLYAVDGAWREMDPDFSIVLSQDELDEITNLNYQEDHVVYTTARLCVNNPGEFYLIPYGTAMVAPATALWLACFDGHKDIYMFGYDYGEVDLKTISAIQKVIQTYSDVNFYHVTNAGSPDVWRRCINFNMMTGLEFISQCDI